MKKIENLSKSDFFDNYIQKKIEKSNNISKNSRRSNTTYRLAKWIADELSDTSPPQKYLKLAKSCHLNLITSAISFVKDYPLKSNDSKSKSKLFFWYLKGKLYYKKKNLKNKVVFDLFTFTD